jgi:hypothetical protein
MSRMTAAALVASGHALAACHAGDPAELKAFNLCKTATAQAYPDSSAAGELSIDVKHIQDVGNAMESCMSGYEYNYDESKQGEA